MIIVPCQWNDKTLYKNNRIKPFYPISGLWCTNDVTVRDDVDRASVMENITIGSTAVFDCKNASTNPGNDVLDGTCG